jgi:polyadenylate-binding protein
LKALHTAEKALAMVHTRPILDLDPPVSFILSIAPNDEILPTPSARPRYVKYLPLGYTDTRLYNILRPFGPIANARIDAVGVGSVQFWHETDAREAEQYLNETFINIEKVDMPPDDPLDLFCSVGDRYISRSRPLICQ